MSRRVSVPDLPTGPRALIWRFLRVPVRLQTYANLLYLSALFPLGLTYFVLLTVGFAFGLTLSVLLVGVVLVIAMVYLTRELTALERFVADRALVVDVPAGATDAPPLSDPVAHLKYVVTSLSTWKGLVYLVSKLVLGVAAFTLLVFLGTLSLSLLFVPLYYENVNVGVRPVSGEMSLEPSVEFALQTWQIGLTIPFQVTTWYVTTLPEALAVSAFGLVATLVSLHLCNLAARVVGWYTSLLLGGTDPSTIRRSLDV
ncbi:sensor domain-containing protein [Halosimplex salinum]|uniref:sensor domain-containing protein n=1 Tax=Halosimplex salinum TaxID=1710538 RepID=UPI000F4AE79C|nr:sensor domain-containing protein [Halosimplex salinum]